MINFLMIMEKAVCTLGSITFHDKKIKSNYYQFLCVLRLINILVLFLLRHLNWIDRYSTMKIGLTFLFEYITSVSEYSKSIRLQFKWIKVPYYGVLYYFTAQVTYVTLWIPLNIQDMVSNTTCLYLFACWHRSMYFFLLWLICWGSNSKHKLP